MIILISFNFHLTKIPSIYYYEINQVLSFFSLLGIMSVSPTFCREHPLIWCCIRQFVADISFRFFTFCLFIILTLFNSPKNKVTSETENL